MFCVYCGKKNPPEAHFCFNCGKPMQAPPAATISSQPSGISSQPKSLFDDLLEPRPVISNETTNVPTSKSNQSNDTFGLADILMPFDNEQSAIRYQPIKESADNLPYGSPVSTSDLPLSGQVADAPTTTPPTQTNSTNPAVNSGFAAPVNTQSPQFIAPTNAQPPLQNTFPNNPNLGGQQPPLYNQPPQPSFNYPSYSSQPYAPQSTPNYYNNVYYTPRPATTYNPYVVPASFGKVTQLHPLLQGVVGLPYEFYLHPEEWYSFVNAQGKVALVKLAGYGQRVSAMLIDGFILFIFNVVLFVVLGVSIAPQLGQTGNRGTAATDVPIWFWLIGYAINLGYLWVSAIGGQTLGKRATHIRVRLLDGSNPGWFLSLLRAFSGYLLSASVGIIGFIVISLLSVIADGSNPSGYNSSGSGLFGLGFLLFLAGSTIGYLWPLRDSKRQAWHDKLVRSIVTENTVWLEGINFGLPPRPPTPPQNQFTPAPAPLFNPSQNPFAQQ